MNGDVQIEINVRHVMCSYYFVYNLSNLFVNNSKRLTLIGLAILLTPNIAYRAADCVTLARKKSNASQP